MRTIAPLGLLTATAGFVFVGLSAPACEELPCDLSCPAEGLVEGNAAISGIQSIDAFFGVVVDLVGASASIRANVESELDGIALGLGLEAGAAPADIAAAIEAKIAAHVDGNLELKYAPPKCEASIEVTANAAASCDASVDPGSAEVSCEGTCTIDASAQAECSANGTLTCKGQAPNLACEGTCTGTCSLEVAATCEGICRGTCTGGCSVVDANGSCNGQCMDECQGSCELEAGGKCDGACEGSCEYTPPSGTCDAQAEAQCTASADANIECKGGCDGKVTPPSVSAECQATVEAKAEAAIECQPPSVEVSFQFKAGLSAEAQADFRAWIGNFKGHVSGLAAANAKAVILLETRDKLATAGVAAIETVASQLTGEADLRASIGAGCALDQLGATGELLGGAAQDLSFSADAALTIVSATSG
jgi:hypothetical protein